MHLKNCILVELEHVMEIDLMNAGPPHKLQKHMQVKLNTDDSPGVATEYGIRSIPTIMLFKGGKRLDTIIGAVPKDNLLKTINKITN